MFAACGAAVAQTFPMRPVQVALAAAPGSASDTLAKLLAQRLTDTWRQDVRLDERSPGNATAAAERVARAYADGYTLLIATPAFAVDATLARSLPYDSGRDFLPVTNIASAPVLLVVPLSGATRLEELLERARAEPRVLAYASAGPANLSHLAAEHLARMAGIGLRQAPSKGATNALAEVLAERVALMFCDAPTALPHLRMARLRALATGSAKRSTLLPDLPTVAESGLPGFEASHWNGMLAPARTPAAVIARLNADVAAVVNLPDMRERLSQAGFDPVGDSQREFALYLGEEIRKWGALVKTLGLKPG